MCNLTAEVDRKPKQPRLAIASHPSLFIHSVDRPGRDVTEYLGRRVGHGASQVPGHIRTLETATNLGIQREREIRNRSFQRLSNLRSRLCTPEAHGVVVGSGCDSFSVERDHQAPEQLRMPLQRLSNLLPHLRTTKAQCSRQIRMQQRTRSPGGEFEF